MKDTKHCRERRIRMRKKEILIICGLLVVAILGFGIFQYLKQVSNNCYIADASGRHILEFNLDEDGYYEVTGDYGTFHLEVKDSKMRAVDVECPNHDCEAMGWVSRDFPMPIVCLPNNLIVVIDE